MRVLHLTTHLNPGGITVYIYRLIEPFRKLGIETFVISSGGDYVRHFREKGAKTVDIPIKTKNEYHPKLYFAIPKIMKFIKENDIEVIHAHTRVTQAIGFWISFFTGVPVVTTCHGYFKRRVGRRINPAWGRKTIAISEGVADELRQTHRVEDAQICVINNGIDIDGIDGSLKQHLQFNPKPAFGFQTNDVVLGVVSRLVEDKGHKYLVEAVEILKKDVPNIQLLIVGDGKYREALEKQIAESSAKDHIKMTGNIMDVTQALAAMDIFVFPATWREGFGLSISEAMACGIPVIATNIWALNTLIEHRRNGLIVEPKNPYAIAEAVQLLLKDEGLSASIVQEARERTSSLFTVSRMAQEIDEIYRSVCA